MHEHTLLAREHLYDAVCTRGCGLGSPLRCALLRCALLRSSSFSNTIASFTFVPAHVVWWWHQHCELFLVVLDRTLERREALVNRCEQPTEECGTRDPAAAIASGSLGSATPAVAASADPATGA